jgi:hypothetical protein
MKETKLITNDRAEGIPLVSDDIKKEYVEVDILRKAYELILDNSNLFFTELEKSFRVEREKGEFNPMI